MFIQKTYLFSKLYLEIEYYLEKLHNQFLSLRHFYREIFKGKIDCIFKPKFRILMKFRKSIFPFKTFSLRKFIEICK